MPPSSTPSPARVTLWMASPSFIPWSIQEAAITTLVHCQGYKSLVRDTSGAQILKQGGFRGCFGCGIQSISGSRYCQAGQQIGFLGSVEVVESVSIFSRSNTQSTVLHILTKLLHCTIFRIIN